MGSAVSQASPILYMYYNPYSPMLPPRWVYYLGSKLRVAERRLPTFRPHNNIIVSILLTLTHLVGVGQIVRYVDPKVDGSSRLVRAVAGERDGEQFERSAVGG